MCFVGKCSLVMSQELVNTQSRICRSGWLLRRWNSVFFFGDPCCLRFSYNYNTLLMSSNSLANCVTAHFKQALEICRIWWFYFAKSENVYQVNIVAQVWGGDWLLNWWICKKGVPYSMWLASAVTVPEPLGVALIISTWNFPFCKALLAYLHFISNWITRQQRLHWLFRGMVYA